jgi:hypothetical protein
LFSEGLYLTCRNATSRRLRRWPVAYGAPRRSSSDLTYNYFQYGLITICTISLLIFLFYFDKGLDKDFDKGLDKDFDKGLDIDFDKGLDIDFDKGLDIDIPIKKIYPEYWDSEKMKIFSKPNWRENPQFWYNLNFLGPKEINWVRLWKTFVFTNRFLFGFFNSF